MSDDLKPLLMQVLQKLDTVVGDLTEVKSGLAEVRSDLAEVKSDVAFLKAHAARTDERLERLEKNDLATAEALQQIKAVQMTMQARITNQWNVITTLIPTRIAAIG